MGYAAHAGELHILLTLEHPVMLAERRSQAMCVQAIFAMHVLQTVRYGHKAALQ